MDRCEHVSSSYALTYATAATVSLRATPSYHQRRHAFLLLADGTGEMTCSCITLRSWGLLQYKRLGITSCHPYATRMLPNSSKSSVGNAEVQSDAEMWPMG